VRQHFKRRGPRGGGKGDQELKRCSRPRISYMSFPKETVWSDEGGRKEPPGGTGGVKRLPNPRD